MNKTIKTILILAILPFIIIILMLYRQYNLDKQKSALEQVDTGSVMMDS